MPAAALLGSGCATSGPATVAFTPRPPAARSSRSGGRARGCLLDPFRPDVLAGVAVLRAAGLDQREVAARLRVSEKTVARYMRELRRRSERDGPGVVVRDQLPAWDLFWARRRTP